MSTSVGNKFSWLWTHYASSPPAEPGKDRECDATSLANASIVDIVLSSHRQAEDSTIIYCGEIVKRSSIAAFAVTGEGGGAAVSFTSRLPSAGLPSAVLKPSLSALAEGAEGGVESPVSRKAPACAGTGDIAVAQVEGGAVSITSRTWAAAPFSAILKTPSSPLTVRAGGGVESPVSHKALACAGAGDIAVAQGGGAAVSITSRTRGTALSSLILKTSSSPLAARAGGGVESPVSHKAPACAGAGDITVAQGGGAAVSTTSRTRGAGLPSAVLKPSLSALAEGAGGGVESSASYEAPACAGAGDVYPLSGAAAYSTPGDGGMAINQALFSSEYEKFFEEMKRADIRTQSFFQELHAALSSKGRGCMSSDELWEELELVYKMAEYLLSTIGAFTPSLCTHKENEQLPRSFIMWTLGNRVYVTILLNRHKIPQEGGGTKGDERLNIDSREKKFSFGLKLNLFQNTSVKKVLVVSRIPQKLKTGGGERFLNEYHIYRSLPPSKYLARVHVGVDKPILGTENYKNIYVMPFYEQGDAFSLVETMCYTNGGREDHTPFISRMFKQMAEILALLHDHGIVHRDVKPENIFVKFKEVSPGKSARKNPQRFLLADYEFMGQEPLERRFLGTPPYLAPEFFQESKTVDYKAADVWALGATVLSSYANQHPFLDPSNKRISLKGITQVCINERVDICFAFNPYAARLDVRIKSLVKDMLTVNDKERITMRQVSTYINSYLPD